MDRLDPKAVRRHNLVANAGIVVCVLVLLALALALLL